MLAKYLEAEAAVLSGKTVTFAGRTLTTENLADVRKGRIEWERRVQAESARGPTVGGLSFSTARFND
ncbi:hypothetical protein GN316_15380 [Xylophilus sp. Kf1]|nr:hypothetical protein [Xylophilus sp. Kf1]